MPIVAGVDSSTQSCKVEIRDLDSGQVIAVGRGAHPPTSPPRSEQDPNAWWAALVDAFGEVGSVAGQVAAIGVGGQQHGMVVLDADNRPLRPAKLWNDTESAAEAARLTEAVGAETWAARVGSVPVASFTISKLAWLVQHEHDLVGRIVKVLLPHDYLNLRLTGAHATDRGDASGSGWFDARTGECATELLELVGGRDDWASLVPTVLGPTEVLGTVTGEAAAALGVPEGIPVGPGSGDNMAAALGLGSRPAMSPSRSARRVSCTQRRRHRQPIRRAQLRASPTPRAATCRSCAPSTPRRSPTRSLAGSGWITRRLRPQRLMRLPALMVSGSPLFRRRADTQPARCNGHVRRASQRHDVSGSARAAHEGCFAACSSDVRPWPPQEQRSMGECT